MNIPIEDITNYIKNTFAMDVFIDEFHVYTPTDNVLNNNQTMVKSEPGVQEEETSIAEITFGVYVKNANSANGRRLSLDIVNNLHNKGGKLINTATGIVFKKIYCVTDSYYFGVTETNSRIYLARFWATYQNKEANITYQN